RKTADVSFDTARLGGPSAGLAFALTLVDLSTPGGLLAGHTVAATGAISNDGTVGTVGGIRIKTLAARAAGAEVFLVPAENYADAVANAGSMRVVSVGGLAAAIRVLETLRVTRGVGHCRQAAAWGGRGRP